MTASRIARIVVLLSGVFFASLGVAIWMAPELVGAEFGVEAVQGSGTATMRADFGGLFAGMAVLCATSAWTLSSPWIVAAATMLTAIVTGRTLGWIGAGRIGRDVIEMGIEVAILAALIALARETTPSAARVPGGAVVPRASTTRRRWRLAIVAATIMLPVVSLAALLSPGAQQEIFEAGAERRASIVNSAPLVDDALRVAVCGSSAPLPSAARAKSCVAVFAGGKFYVVDVGPESVENMVLWGIPMGSIGGVLLTHFHSDHIGDLGELNLQTWAAGRPGPMQIYGGPGVERVVAGFGQAYRLDQGYRTAHHGERVMPSTTWPMIAHTIALDGPETPAKNRTAIVLDEGGLRITAVEVDHAPIAPAYAYRFDYKGRSALVTGDLKYHAPLVKAAEGVDVLVSEAIALSMTRALGRGATSAGRTNTAAVMHDIEDYHLTTAQAAAVANDAHARLLVFYHLLPAPDGAIARSVFARGIDDIRKDDWTIADDGSLYTMPLGSTAIDVGRMTE